MAARKKATKKKAAKKRKKSGIPLRVMKNPKLLWRLKELEQLGVSRKVFDEMVLELHNELMQKHRLTPGMASALDVAVAALAAEALVSDDIRTWLKAARLAVGLK